MDVLAGQDVGVFDVNLFRPTREDRTLVTRLLGGSIVGKERWDAVTRLSQIAAVNGCLAVRTALATFGGIGPDEVSTYTGAVGVSLGHKMDDVAFGNVLSLAREARSAGDYEAFTALIGSVGIYPPELSDYTVVTPEPSIQQPTSLPGFNT